MTRRTKIIATIGPASESEGVLREMIQAGMDIARIGLAHGTYELAEERIKLIRKVASEEGKPVGILLDLPGPKIRVGDFGEKQVELVEGSNVELFIGSEGSTIGRIEVDYEGLLTHVQEGAELNIGDGRAVVKVTSVLSDRLQATILHGGVLSGRPGVHIPSDQLSLTAPTSEDLEAIDRFLPLGIDILALSFVRTAGDIERLNLPPHPDGPLVVAKIETQAALEDLPGIIDTAGAIMVARGDLGQEYGIEGLPMLQKNIIRECIASGRPAITATQMLESMVDAPEPTRAEVSDVANAVWDGSSAVMLSGETAIGSDPVNVISTMGRIVERADQEFDHRGWVGDLAEIRLTNRAMAETSITDAMTLATSRAVVELGIKTIVCISGSGFTVRSMARFRPSARILGLSSDERTVGQLSLSWGTEPRHLSVEGTIDDRVVAALQLARDNGDLESGQMVAVLAGTSDSSRSTNVLRIEQVP